MTTFEAITIVAQFLVPLALIAWIGLGSRRTRSALALDTVIAGSYLLSIYLAAPWLALPRWVVWLMAALLAVVSAKRLWGAGRDAAYAGGHPRKQRIGLAARAVVVTALVGVCGIALMGRRGLPGDAVELAFPLRAGSYLVAAGGSQALLNPHLQTLHGERFRDYRGQSYAVDVVRLGGWGSRRSGLSPDTPEGFAIYGDSLFAPCSGTVTTAVDQYPDRLAPGSEPATLAGNHLMLECGEVWVLLAHLRRGSVQASEGEAVEVGQWLATAGNSGNSGEPHLHIHAQKRGTTEAPLSGEPVPITFHGRQLVRGDRVTPR